MGYLIVVIALSAAATYMAVYRRNYPGRDHPCSVLPCALVLATPTAIMAAIGNVTKHGFLVREGDALERLSKVKIIAFDKTGTLTHGTPKVVKAVSVSGNYTSEQIYQLTAAAEQYSEHPLGKLSWIAAKRSFKKNCLLPMIFA